MAILKCRFYCRALGYNQHAHTLLVHWSSNMAFTVGFYVHAVLLWIMKTCYSLAGEYQHFRQTQYLNFQFWRSKSCFVVCFLLGNSPASEFRRQGITQKKAHYIRNTAKVWNQVVVFSSWRLVPTYRSIIRCRNHKTSIAGKILKIYTLCKYILYAKGR